MTIQAELIVGKILGVIISPDGTLRAAKPKRVPPCLQGGAAGQGGGPVPRGAGCDPAVQTTLGSASPRGREDGSTRGLVGNKQAGASPRPLFPTFPRDGQKELLYDNFAVLPLPEHKPSRCFQCLQDKEVSGCCTCPSVRLSVLKTVCQALTRDSSSLLWAAWWVQVCRCTWYPTPPAAAGTALAASPGTAQSCPQSPGGAGTNGTSAGDGLFASPSEHTCGQARLICLQNRSLCMAMADASLPGLPGDGALWQQSGAATGPWVGRRREKKWREVGKVCAPVLGLRQPEVCEGEVAASCGSEAAIFASEY